MKKYWIIAGEASGDLYGAGLATELKNIAAERGEDISISGMGGAKMIAAGVPVLVDSTELGVMGIIEVVKLLFTFFKIFRFLVKKAKEERPDAVILIDYPGFNLRFAKAMYKAGIPVYWYISPQVWVWGKRRLPILAKICTKMLVIFPFETEVYAAAGMRAEFVGHPLIDIVNSRRDPTITRDDNEILLLPGSRRMEVERLLPEMLKTVTILSQKHPNLRFHISAPRQKIVDLCLKEIDKFKRKSDKLPEITIGCGDTGIELQRATAGLASSGTVTVESAISGLPLVVGYRMNWITLLIASVLVKLYRGFFTMVNIIANRVVFEEFLQWRFCSDNLVPALEKILPGGERRDEVLAGMAEVKSLLSPGSTSAARRVAEACWETPEKTQN